MFETKNTKLTAALLTLGFELDNRTVFNGEEVVLRVKPGMVMGYEPPDFDRLWRDQNWQRRNPQHPFIHIVKIAEAREWLLNRVVYRYNSDSGPPTCETFRTDKLALAACIVADGFYLLFFESETFYFPKDAETIAKRFSHPDDVIEVQLHYLAELKSLLQKIRNRSPQLAGHQC
jgi:hypothetical protein